jgi:hypothetical protein
MNNDPVIRVAFCNINHSAANDKLPDTDTGCSLLGTLGDLIDGDNR